MPVTDQISTHICHRISIEYDLGEDRLLVHCELPDQTSISFYLTARFTSLLVGHLFVHERLDDLLAHWHPQLTQDLPEDDPVAAEDSVSKAPIEELEYTTDNPTGTGRHVLVNRCDLTIGEDQSVTFKFDLSHHPKSCILALSLTSLTLNQFLAVLHRKFVVADWSDHAWQKSKEATQGGVSSGNNIVIH